MARRVVSLVDHPGGRTVEANAYALAEDLELTLVLRRGAVELAVAGGAALPGTIAGVDVPASAAPADLRGLAESGVRVLAVAADVRDRGLASEDLVPGVALAADDDVLAIVTGADAVVRW